MEKVVINPKDVRGLGDIVSPKQSSDFLRYGCIVTDSADSTLGTVYSTTVKSTGSVLSLTYPRYTEVGVTSFTVEALLKNSSNSAITSATVHLLVNDVHMTATTNSSGKATFTVSVGSNPPSSYRIQCYYIGSSSINGCFANATVVTIDDVGNVDLDLFVEKPVIQTGEHDNLIARLHDGSRGVPGQTVYFYEEYEPTTLLLGSDKSIIQTGEQANLRATLKDEDGSGIEGETVKFYYNDHIIYVDTALTDKSTYYTPTKCEGGSLPSMTFDTDHYNITGGSQTTMLVLTSIGKLENCTIELKVKPSSTSFSGAIGLALADSAGNAYGFVGYSDGQSRVVQYDDSVWVPESSSYHTGAVDSNGIMTITAVKNGRSVTLNAGDADKTITLPNSTCYIGLMFGNGNNNKYYGIEIKESV